MNDESWNKSADAGIFPWWGERWCWCTVPWSIPTASVPLALGLRLEETVRKWFYGLQVSYNCYRLLWGYSAATVLLWGHWVDLSCWALVRLSCSDLRQRPKLKCRARGKLGGLSFWNLLESWGPYRSLSLLGQESQICGRNRARSFRLAFPYFFQIFSSAQPLSSGLLGAIDRKNWQLRRLKWTIWLQPWDPVQNAAMVDHPRTQCDLSPQSFKTKAPFRNTVGFLGLLLLGKVAMFCVSPLAQCRQRIDNA